MRRYPQKALFWALSLPLLFSGGLGAQDVELLGKLHGTRPPQAYFDLMDRDPGAYQFQRALVRRGLRLRELPPIRAEGRAMSTALTPAFAGALAEAVERAPMVGTFNFPLILGLFSDSPEPQNIYSRENVQQEFFDGPQANPDAVGTVPEFYAEMSGGLVNLSGVTFDWQRVTLTQATVTAGESGLGESARTGEFIAQVLDRVDDGSVDWGQFDNDGPDGLPNSGDDDGYVDVLIVVHPTPGGECGSPDRPNRIWSHRWNLYSSAFFEGGSWAQPVLDNEGYVTTTPTAPGTGFPFVRILDYTIQPVTNCAFTAPNTIGVFAHELGHGFGLPDLYGVNANHNGIGNWGLMGTGSWGCNGFSPHLPCHMMAWSKSILGWVEVETIPPGADLQTLTVPPVETSRKVYRIDSGDGSGEYFLLENRQKRGFDLNLYEPGLLVWHIDPVTIAEKWPTNGINSDGERLGVWLRQADGVNDLARGGGGRGDAGDPFPGSTKQTEMHAGSRPGSWTHDGAAMGITFLDIRLTGDEVDLRALTGYQPLTLRTEGSPSGKGLISVDGVFSEEAEWIFDSAPFQEHTITAAPGEEVGAGIRVGFQGWTDGAPRVREYETGLEGGSFTATYGGREVHLDITLTGPVEGISPGAVDFDPGDGEGWVPEGETVALMAQPRMGFGFLEWTGILAGRPNPTTLTADAPLQAGALFDLTFSTVSNPPSVEIGAAATYFLALEVENANPPVSWTLTSGTLPHGMRLDPIGRISGAAMELGTFPLAFQVRDAIGLEAGLSLDLVVVDPVISIERLASPFLLTGAPLDFNEKTFLDLEGNRNGVYDLGDFRAFFLRNPNAPRSGDIREVFELLVPMGDMRAGSGGDHGRGKGGR
ncbi:MAG: M6 family metalloprotease domain-containing protein [Longimicrobiales bacterium]